jgi:hypothetical protein
MLFDYLKDILLFKKGTLPLGDYVPFLINRWLSFGIPKATTILNDSVNSLGNIDKEQHYKLLLTCFPKLSYLPRMSYIKKIKQEKTEEDDKLKMLANSMELSEREIKQLLELKELTN